MKLLIINSVCGIRSTGKICKEIANEYQKNGYEVKIAYGREKPSADTANIAKKIGNSFSVYAHTLLTRLLDNHGFSSWRTTKEFLEWVDNYKPDLIWLHNLHGYYINVEMLFDWLKKHPDIKVKWTLHDCWAFTGHCSYFTACHCQKWKEQCRNCIQKAEYPTSFCVDASASNYLRKKNCFTGLMNMTLVTPSQWLADLVGESFLSAYPVEVVRNKIDKSVFKPTLSDFKSQYGIENKKVLLGVASPWSKRKGLNDLLWLSKQLDDTFVIVLVGISEKQLENALEQLNQTLQEGVEAIYFDVVSLEAGQVIQANKQALLQSVCQYFGESYNSGSGTAKIIGINRTDSPKKLAEIYSSADLFLNPTYEDNYPTVNLEARACGTYIITYNTGGCQETMQEEY